VWEGTADEKATPRGGGRHRAALPCERRIGDELLVYTQQRPLVLTVNGGVMIHSMAQTSGNPTLIAKTATSDWTSLSTYPWQAVTGLAGASLTDSTSQTDWGGQAAFYAVGGSPLRLWQCNYAVGSSS